MFDPIKNSVCESCKNNLDKKILKELYDMNSREFAFYLISGGNHQAEIQYHLSRDLPQDYINRVLEIVTEELWFNQKKLGEIRSGPLKKFYP
ncbi:Uncharacterised protein [uncultured archaeon]|nr:Uncharacterised protein [uncultured archaeon]